jgi:hypothetical protein
MANRLTIYQGNTFPIVATITNEAGTAINLTGLTVSLTIYNGSTEILQIDNTSHTTPASGITTFTVTKNQTLAFPAPCLLSYEIEVVYVDGSKFTATRDYIEVIKDFT